MEDRQPNWSQDMLTVQEVSEMMRSFGIWDYTVFAFMLVACGFVGIYFGFIKKSSGEDEYLVGGRNMKTFPVSLSLIASFISGRSSLEILNNYLRNVVTIAFSLKYLDYNNNEYQFLCKIYFYFFSL